MLILADNLWEHQCVEQNLVRDVRKIVELREQILGRSRKLCMKQTRRQTKRAANAGFSRTAHIKRVLGHKRYPGRQRPNKLL
jgi:hypothetical protein